MHFKSEYMPGDINIVIINKRDKNHALNSSKLIHKNIHLINTLFIETSRTSFFFIQSSFVCVYACEKQTMRFYYWGYMRVAYNHDVLLLPENFIPRNSLNQFPRPKTKKNSL